MVYKYQIYTRNYGWKYTLYHNIPYNMESVSEHSIHIRKLYSILQQKKR